MPEDWCDHCDLPKSQCIHSLPKQPRFPDALVTGPTIEASIVSPCDLCVTKIEPGDSITYTDQGWVHTKHVQDQVGRDTPPDSSEMFKDFP